MVDALLWLAIASTVASCLAAIGARALREFSRHELQEICERRQKLDSFGEIVRSHDQVALGVEMFVVLGIALATAAGGIWAYERFVLPEPRWLELLPAVAGIALAIVVMTVCIPWAISRVGAELFLYFTWPAWQFVGMLTRPLVWLAYAFDSLLQRLTGRAHDQLDEDAFEEEIRSIVTEGHREGLLEEEAREMIESVIELGDVVVSHIMTPRTEMSMLQAGQPWEEVIDFVTTSGHTRIPVYDKNRDDIIGILYSKDLLPELAKPPSEPRRKLVELLRKPLFVPESKAVNDLLRVFQQSRTHIAIVLDEYGGVSGLVTIEDALEEIVGEIDDEFDSPSDQDILKIDDDVCEALGRAHVEEINSTMDFDLPEDENFDTVGGFVFTEFGRVPSVGEKLTWNDSVQVTVLEANRRRVGRVRLERIRQEAAEMA
jgi:CBS domain containing-hemolysin-like protein